MAEKIDCAVIGAGVIGLAVARTLAKKGMETVILESADAFGTATSSRNSEVIHAGIYYPPGSLKARLCVDGNRMLYDFCASRGIPHRRCTKMIVATEEDERVQLRDMAANAERNGVDDLQMLDGEKAREMEPNLRCLEAMLSPSTGILDSHALMLSLLGEAEDHGAAIAYNSPVTGGQVNGGALTLEVGGAEPMELDCRAVVNCAGLEAQAVALSLKGVPAKTVPQRHLAKGSYFYLSAPPPFSCLIYPVPTSASLGMHFTLDLGGQGRFGPDVEWIDAIDYTLDGGRAETFCRGIRRYWPEISTDMLQPGYTGIRPKIQARGEPSADFVIQGPEIHGIKGLINLFGIESPGLTASLAIAEEVAEKIG